MTPVESATQPNERDRSAWLTTGVAAVAFISGVRRMGDKEDQARYNATHKEQRRAFDKAYRQRPEVKARRRAAPRRLAWYSVRRAIVHGLLVQGDCHCGRIDTVAHHPNGYGPDHELDVVWLCHQHHRLIHLAATEP